MAPSDSCGKGCLHDVGRCPVQQHQPGRWSDPANDQLAGQVSPGQRAQRAGKSSGEDAGSAPRSNGVRARTHAVTRGCSATRDGRRSASHTATRHPAHRTPAGSNAGSRPRSRPTSTRQPSTGRARWQTDDGARCVPGAESPDATEPEGQPLLWDGRWRRGSGRRDRSGCRTSDCARRGTPRPRLGAAAVPRTLGRVEPRPAGRRSGGHRLAACPRGGVPVNGRIHAHSFIPCAPAKPSVRADEARSDDRAACHVTITDGVEGTSA